MASDLLERRREQVFPKLTPAQIARLQAHGTRTDTRTGEVLIEPGERHRKLLVVLSGSLEAALPGMLGEELITVLSPGDFTGEMSTLRGVAGFVRVRVREGGAVLVIDEENLRNVVQTDAELSEILMRAFILRRMGLLASGNSDAMLLGSRHSAETLRWRSLKAASIIGAPLRPIAPKIETDVRDSATRKARNVQKPRDDYADAKLTEAVRKAMNKEGARATESEAYVKLIEPTIRNLLGDELEQPNSPI